MAADVVKMLNYTSSHPVVDIKYHAIGLFLHMDNDVSYLSVRKARSRIGEYCHLSSPSSNATKPPMISPPPNGPLHTVSSILKNVMVSGVEAEMGGLFINGQEAVILRTTL